MGRNKLKGLPSRGNYIIGLDGHLVLEGSMSRLEHIDSFKVDIWQREPGRTFKLTGIKARLRHGWRTLAHSLARSSPASVPHPALLCSLVRIGRWAYDVATWHIKSGLRKTYDLTLLCLYWPSLWQA